MEPRFVYITCKNEEEALEVAEAVVEARLAACANLLPGMRSVYWWKGKIVKEEEVVVVLKSKADNMEALIEKVKSVHSYTVPCVVGLPILEGNPDYLDWLAKEC